MYICMYLLSHLLDLSLYACLLTFTNNNVGAITHDLKGILRVQVNILDLEETPVATIQGFLHDGSPGYLS